MPRPRAATYDDQRTLILARAAELFARRGYTAASMNEVAAACAVSKATLYHYVRDKHALLAQIATEHVARLEALVREVKAQRLAPAEELDALIRRFTAAYADAQHEHRVLTEDVKFLPDTDRDRILAKQRTVVHAFADAVAVHRPDLREHRLDTAVSMLLFGMLNWMFTWLRPDGRLNLATIAPMVCELFFHGLSGITVPEEPKPRRKPR